jgi:hypothetical protein
MHDWAAIMQAAALVFYAGIQTKTVRDLVRRVEKLEDGREDCVIRVLPKMQSDISFIKGREAL